MLRAWGNRPDTFVTDEPLYAHYLLNTGVQHPGRDDVLAAQDNDWRRVVAWLRGPIPGGRTIWYQKHMAHHLLGHIDRVWLDTFTHCFLIREPREMLTSLVKNLPNPTIYDTGLPQQLELVRLVRTKTGQTPPIVDARDVLENPRGMLTALCQAIGVSFTEAMLSWPPGQRETDGVWAPHWYAAVERSTGFEPYRAKGEAVPNGLIPLLAECERLYRELAAQKLTP